MKTAIAILIVATLSPAGEAAKYVVIFDFECRASPKLGRQLADSVRLRLRRHKGYDVLDKLTTAEMTPDGGMGPGEPDRKVIALLKDRFAAQVAVMGRLERMGDGFRAEVRCVDISAAKPVTWTKVFSDNTERARGVIAKGIIEAIRRSAEWKPPEYGDEAEPKTFGQALNRSGDFESGSGWQRPDNVSMKIVADPRAGRSGKVLRIFTDLDREAWLKYQRDLRLGKADPATPPKIGTVANKYATVAGLEGVHFRSKWIRATPGQRYWLIADMKGRTAGIFFPKIFVKGFADFSAVADGLSDVSLNEMGISADAFAKMPPAKRKELVAADVRKHPDRYRREVYRWYLACRNQENVWKHYGAPFPPRGGLPKVVRWFRIDVYAYWPPGEFLFDDVHLFKDPRQRTPLPEVKARTPKYKAPSTQPSTADGK